MKLAFILVTAFATIFRAAHSNEVLIKSTDDFLEFIENVNSGNDFSDDTVVLNSDLDFSGHSSIDVIAPVRETPFSGTFTGQGHLIRNLHINTTERYAGLFGYTRGATLKNFMLDETCTVTSHAVWASDVFVGGILGRCYTVGKACHFDNAVSKAAVTFSGRAGSDASVGGLIGSCDYSNYYCSIKNNANFGAVTVTAAGVTDWFAQLGGIVGLCGGNSEKRCKIHDCLNYGSLTHSGTAKNVIIGGIVGTMSSATNVQNCVSAGSILNQNSGKYNHVGGIAGYAFNEDSSLARSYWLPSVGVDKAVGYNVTELEIDEPVVQGEASEEMVAALNGYAASNGWDMWALNLNGATFALQLNGAVIFTSKYEIIQIPNFASYEGYTFSGLYADPEIRVPVKDFVIEEDTVFYSTWTLNEYNITFVFNETYNETWNFSFTEEVDLPELDQRAGHTAEWCTADRTTCDPAIMHPRNLILYPTYTAINNSESSGELDIEDIGDASHYVMITFNMEAMFTAEVEDIISKYSEDNKHHVIGIEANGVYKEVTIKFDNPEAALKFVNELKSNPADAKKDKIVKVTFLDDSLFSASISFLPLSFLFNFLI